MLLAASILPRHSPLYTLAGLAILAWAAVAFAATVDWIKRRAGGKQHASPSGVSTIDQAEGAGRPGAALTKASRWGGRRLSRDSGATPQTTATPLEAAGANFSPSPAIAAPCAPERPPVVSGPRYSPETLEPLGDVLEISHGAGVAEDRTASVLASLPSDRWLVQRYAVFSDYRVHFLIVGETGVFALWVVVSPPTWDQLPLASRVSPHVKQALPGYPGPVHAGYCRGLASTPVEPRWWSHAGGPGAWVMSPERIIPWLESFGTEHGLSLADLARLRDLAKPKHRPPPRSPLAVPDLW